MTSKQKQGVLKAMGDEVKKSSCRLGGGGGEGVKLYRKQWEKLARPFLISRTPVFIVLHVFLSG
jgi:hypothetical protein